MALKKPILTDYGIEVIYWRIGSINDSFHGQIQILLEGYLNEESRKARKTPLERITVYVEGVELKRSEIYLMLKSHLNFQNAEDI